MKFKIGSEVYEATPDNSCIFEGTTLIQGIFIDLEENYLFLPTEILDNSQELYREAQEEGIAYHTLLDYDPEAEPFVYIINAMCRMFAREVECSFEEPC